MTADELNPERILAVHMDADVAALVAFMCRHWPQFRAAYGTDEQREALDETFVGLAEAASRRLDKVIAEARHQEDQP